MMAEIIREYGVLVIDKDQRQAGTVKLSGHLFRQFFKIFIKYDQCGGTAFYEQAEKVIEILRIILTVIQKGKIHINSEKGPRSDRIR